MNPTLCELADIVVKFEENPEQMHHIRNFTDEELLAPFAASGIGTVVAAYYGIREVLRRTGRLDCNVPEDIFSHPSRSSSSRLERQH